MTLYRNISSMAFLSLLAACAGSVETIDGENGDGDDSPQGDGDYNGDGDGPVPGDGDYYGDGDYVGDGDAVRPPGVGGGPVGPPGVGGGIIVPGPGGLPTLPPIDPATCSPAYEYNDSNRCERGVECSGTWAYVWCDSYGDGAQCGCDRNGGYFSVSVDSSFIAEGAGCDRMMDACLGGGELEVVGDATCRTQYLEQNADYCGTNVLCETPVEFGGQVGNVQSWSDVWCNEYGDEWVCECYSGNSSGRITFVDDVSSPDVCLDTVGMCSSALIDPNLPSTCEPRSQFADRDYCSFELECKQRRTLDMHQVEVSAWKFGGCQSAGGGAWDCSCGGGVSSFGVTGGTPWEACSVASTQCSR